MDKRRYARFVSRLEVGVKRVEGEALDRFIPVVSKDISLAGIGLVSEEKFQAGEKIKMAVKMPGDINLHISGVIKWVNERENLYSTSGRDFVFGVEFTDLSDTDRKTIENFIAQTGYDPAGAGGPPAQT